MPFETIENIKKLAAQIAVFPEGVRVEARALTKAGRTYARFIKITIGAQLARKLFWRDEKVPIELAFGTGKDAGKIRAVMDASGGQFVARRIRQGHYTITISAATADGLFSLTFPRFDIPAVEPVHEIGKPPMLVFKASEEMLAAE
ncbi:hypothetical protein [Pseudorhodoplanes sp.]|uniref:hypothetical protein n=1 Tax=Pseudorhodoplanes sp. TaxID=1934341 RepID=UPI00391930BC